MNASNLHQPFGWLTWWTIYQGIYNVNNLTQTGTTVNLTPTILKNVVGAEEKSAWLKATQLGAVGRDVKTADPDKRAKFYTRDLGGETRAITYEIVDREDKKVFSQQAATLGRDGTEILADVEPWVAQDQFVLNPLIETIESMQSELLNRIGNVDDVKIRSLVLQWLKNKHRVCVRGHGGVYYIPGNDQQTQDEILAVREWIDQSGLGSFSVVSLRNDGATSLSDFQNSAVDEVLQEIREVSDTLEKYADDPNLRSANTQIKRVAELEEKIKTLNENLGDIQDKVNAEFMVVSKFARRFLETARQSSSVKKAQRESTGQDSGKKSGSILDRKKRKQV